MSTTTVCEVCKQPMASEVDVARLELGYNTHLGCSQAKAAGMYFLAGREEGEVIPVISRSWAKPVSIKEL